MCNRIKMWRYLVLVALVAVAFESTITGVQAEDPIDLSPIVSELDATIEQYSYHVALIINGNFECGGIIISNEWLLTAAHCALNASFEYKARLGSTFRDFGGTVYSIDTVIAHKDYRQMDPDLETTINDIAALKVSTPITFDSTRQPIPLFDANEVAEPGVNAVTSGWGILLENNASLPETLKAVILPIISKANCTVYYENYSRIPEGEICAGYPDSGKDRCNGESGGALAISGRLAGIVIWGNGCARLGYPGVYTEVAQYRDWIKEHTGV